MAAKAKWTKVADAWKYAMAVMAASKRPHAFGPPTINDFTFVGTQYSAVCAKCNKTLYVRGGWGGPGLYGPAESTNCEAAR